MQVASLPYQLQGVIDTLVKVMAKFDKISEIIEAIESESEEDNEEDGGDESGGDDDD